jgi:hypothetical protein
MKVCENRILKIILGTKRHEKNRNWQKIKLPNAKTSGHTLNVLVFSLLFLSLHQHQIHSATCSLNAFCSC